MLDPKLLRSDPHMIAEKIKTRGIELDFDVFEKLESRRKGLQIKTQELQNERNTKSKNIGKAKASGEDIQPLLDEVQNLGDALKEAENELSSLQNEILDFSLGIPNLPDESVPFGDGEDDNVEIRRWGEPKEFDFEAKDHADLGAASQMMDFEAGAKLTGSRFVVMSGQLAKLHRALTQFMLDVHTTEHGYTEAYVPYIVNPDSLRGTGQLPKFEEDLFKLEGKSNYYLIPTAEVPVTNLVRDVIVEDDYMP
ncbi:MAG: serine--tRNA ligase, partial [Gammaproteobacteria bacterium]